MTHSDGPDRNFLSEEKRNEEKKQNAGGKVNGAETSEKRKVAEVVLPGRSGTGRAADETEETEVQLMESQQSPSAASDDWLTAAGRRVIDTAMDKS